MNILLDEITLRFKTKYAIRYIEKVEKFIDLLSTWYLRRSRKRRDDALYSTMYYIPIITIV
jgi:isoleucyl-tRNA synthetase